MVLERHVVIFAFLFAGCFAQGEGERQDRPSFPLAHNTERNLIAQETAAVLRLYDFTIEYDEPNRQRASLQTQWRTIVSPQDLHTPLFRDRAFLHITRRGRSSVIYNVYYMVNATLEFECQRRNPGINEWEPANPPDDLLKQYTTIVKDIRNRMLKYQSEF